MRLGVFGGTFDPPHVGHLLVAIDAIEALTLDRLVLVPAGVQPLKAGTITASARDRLEMVRLLAGDDPRISVDPIEIEREGLSYTVDTLATFAERHPSAERFYLVGADVMRTFDQWHEPERVRQLAQLVVLQRVGGCHEGGKVGPQETLLRLPGGTPQYLASRRVDVSSTEVRARVRAGRSIRGFVPDAVASFIERAGLYR